MFFASIDSYIKLPYITLGRVVTITVSLDPNNSSLDPNNKL